MLIFAVNDKHADNIVNILKEIYKPNGIDEKAIMKITGKTGTPEEVQNAIVLFKNETNPSIAVTVDLLTTGIDVPEIDCLVFLRRVKSRILFEQMLGRAVRKCDPIGKTHFDIYDAVGVYEALESVNTMKPVVPNESATFEELLNGLKNFNEDEKIQNQIDIIVAKIHRKSRNLSDKGLESFKDLSDGLEPKVFAEKILSMKPKDAKEYLLENRNALDVLYKDLGNRIRTIPISKDEDEIIRIDRRNSTEDYIKEFTNFVNNNKNHIAALNIVCTKPRTLTRKTLKSLKLELERNNFTTDELNNAWNKSKNVNIVADIIAFIRTCALGLPLISLEERVGNAMNKLREKYNFSKEQLIWLSRIEITLKEESIIDRETFELGAFKDHGGFRRINNTFSGQLEKYVDELNKYLYDDEGKTA